MFERLKKYKLRIVGAIIALGVLAAAYWYGGDSPDSHGWVISDSSSYSASPSDSSPSSSEIQSSDLVVQNTASDSSQVRKYTSSDTDDSSSNTDSEEKTKASASDPEDSEEESSSSGKEDTESKDIIAQFQENTEPEPEIYPDQSQQPEKSETECTISISCSAVLDNMDKLDEDKYELVPSDGWLLSETKAVFSDGETVFDLLQRVCRDNGIHLESSWTPLYDSAYIEGIGNLYEFDCGSLSGWMYSVNGEFPNYSCSQYILTDGDVVDFVYTCDLGKDVGGDYYSQNQ